MSQSIRPRGIGDDFTAVRSRSSSVERPSRRHGIEQGLEARLDLGGQEARQLPGTRLAPRVEARSMGSPIRTRGDERPEGASNSTSRKSSSHFKSVSTTRSTVGLART